MLRSLPRVALVIGAMGPGSPGTSRLGKGCSSRKIGQRGGLGRKSAFGISQKMAACPWLWRPPEGRTLARSAAPVGVPGLSNLYTDP